jgi:membrane-bound serine protease (ClpP class)
MELANFLLDPNIAYLVLVLTGVLLINAILTPGTGIVELIAVFLLIVTGYQVYRLPFNGWALVILIVGVIPFFVSVRKNRQSAVPYMFIAIALFEVGSVFLYPGDTWWIPAVNPLFALAVVVLTGGYLWVVMRAAFQSYNQPLAQDLSTLIGKVGEARTEIHIAGTAYVGGELWSATSDEMIPSGKLVKVIGREGMILKVVSAEA